ncbi:heliorhodopsin HeR [Candidatus Saccharibacteria bacterium]|nr:heliorhodopsin HeR [Candidatus Saccharibacteria bacterium]
MSKITKSGLRKLNLYAGGLHLLSAVAVLLLSKNFHLPVTGSYLQFNDASQTLSPATKTLFDMPFVWLIVGFFLLSAAAHLFIATVYNRVYNRNLAKGINKLRWLEYSLSASIMIVAIGMLVGIYDAASLAMLFVLAAIMNLMGLAMEIYNQGREKTNWLAYWIGCLAGVIPWLVIAFYIWLSAQQGSGPPTFVYFIFGSIFIFFNCFAINMWLQYKKIGKWSDYLYGERAYIILSFTAKSALAWQVFAGTLRP